MVLTEVVGAVDVAGGVLLNADDYVVCVEIVNGGYGGVLGHDDRLDAGGVAVGEVDALLALLGDGEAAGADVSLAGLHGDNDGAELHVINLHLVAELVADGLHDVDVNADCLLVLVILVGRECNVGRNDEGLFFRCRGLCAAAAGGEQCCAHYYAKYDCKCLFHFNFSF